MSDREEALLPCPFCGSINVGVGAIRDGYQAICNDCFATGPAKFHGPQGKARPFAIASWNARQSAPQQAQSKIGWCGDRSGTPFGPSDAGPEEAESAPQQEPVTIRQIVSCLEGSAANTDTSPKWLAACELRRIVGWETATLPIAAPPAAADVHAQVLELEAAKCMDRNGNFHGPYEEGRQAGLRWAADYLRLYPKGHPAAPDVVRDELRPAYSGLISGLIQLAAEMAQCKNMPDSDRKSYVSTTMSERREIVEAIDTAENQCKDWAMAVRAIADRLSAAMHPAQGDKHE